MSSIQMQFLILRTHHSHYSNIDLKTTLKGSASGKTIFLTSASRGIGQATAVAFAQAGAEAIYITARRKKRLKKIKEANPEKRCAYMVCDVTDVGRVSSSNLPIQQAPGPAVERQPAHNAATGDMSE